MTLRSYFFGENGKSAAVASEIPVRPHKQRKVAVNDPDAALNEIVS